MLALVNIEREKENLSPLALDEKLNEIAKDKVNLLIKEGKLNHLAGGYKSLGEFLRTYDVEFLMAGENIARKTRTNEETMNLWLNSKGHRANILNKSFTNIGLNHLAGGYKSLGEFLRTYDVEFLMAGENIARKTRTNEETMNLWLNSKGHRANILNKSFTNIGIAKGNDENGDIYWVQIFIKTK